ncbi:hypothetical protein [Microbacterium sp. PAMC22086]|uniref:hypothetical protein n=1 Tax=Microbacterium sp. PAMC22086 TaxID=2861281 RepID=UPI001C628E86|nr:hypothetical protein [Microbacterium sp. PAMC22086]QYG11516.1 hypothetical protein KY497_14870 [Microbacterium sp. PAMC22086]
MTERQPGNTLVNWVLVIGGIAAAVFLWWAFGRPDAGDIGQDIYDGDWSCEIPGRQGLGTMPGPGITVSGGAVTSAHYFDMTNGQDLPVEFTNVQTINTTKLTLTSAYPPFYDLASGSYKFTEQSGTFTCTKD